MASSENWPGLTIFLHLSGGRGLNAPAVKYADLSGSQMVTKGVLRDTMENRHSSNFIFLFARVGGIRSGFVRRFLMVAAAFVSFCFPLRAASPTATSGNQYRMDTATAIAFGGSIPFGVGVYFEANVADPDGQTIKMEVELRKLPATFTGVATNSSSLVSGGSRARTSTATSLAAGNYGWRYRVVDSGGTASNWVAAGNPDFVVQAAPVNHSPAASGGNQYRSDTSGAIPFGSEIAAEVGVYFEADVADVDGDTVNMEVELLKLPGTFTGTATHSSGLVSSGTRAKTATASGLASGNYGWRYRVIDSRGVSSNWVAAGNPDFVVKSANQGPHATSGRQYRDDTNSEIAAGGTVPAGIGVSFAADVTDPDGDGVKIEVELRKLPATFTGTATHVSDFAANGAQARTSAITGLAAGNYGWRYRAVDANGAATNWVTEGNPDFVIQSTNQGPHAINGRQYREDTGEQIASGGTVASGVDVSFGATVTDPDNDTIKIEVELRKLPATFTGVATHVSDYVSSGSQARTAAVAGLAAGNYGWRYRAIDSNGAGTNWVTEGNPDFVISAGRCDLLFDAAPTVSPNPVVAGQDVTFSYSIRNDGQALAGNSETKIQIKNSAGEQITSKVFSEASIGAGVASSRSGSVTIPAGTFAGTYSAYILLDNQSALNQLSEENDVSGVQFSIQPQQQSANKPDLTFSTEITAMAVADNRLRISGFVVNNGTATVPSFQARLTLRRNTGGAVLQQWSFPKESSIAPGGTREIRYEVAITAELTAGAYVADLFLDDANVVSETNEANNHSIGSFSVSFAPTGTPGEPSWTVLRLAHPNNYEPDSLQETVDTIVIHTTNPGTGREGFWSAVNTFENPNLEDPRSAHYLIASDGFVYNMVPLRNRAGHARPRNGHSIGIEVAGNSDDPAMWTPQNEASLRKLVLYLVERYDIPLEHPSGDYAHSPKGFYAGIGIISHTQINGKPDPGWSEQRWATFINELRKERLAGVASIQSSPLSSEQALGSLFATTANTSAASPELTLSLNSPYERIVTLQSSVDLIDWVTEESFVAREGVETRTIRSTGDPKRFFRFLWGK